MSVRLKRLSVLIPILLLTSFDLCHSRSTIPDSARVAPLTSAARGIAYCTATHDVGKIGLLMTNGGMIGTGTLPKKYGISPTPYPADSSGYHLGSVMPESDLWGGEYPLGSGLKCLRVGALWVGAITDEGDTLTSVGYDWIDPLAASYEFYPDLAPWGLIATQSLLDPNTAQTARSDQDYVAVYVDTFKQGLPGLVPDWQTHKHHQPLGIEVTQTSSQWSNPLVDDFVLIEYKIRNIGRRHLHEVFAGLYVDPAHDQQANLDFLRDVALDELTGFLSVFPSQQGCGFYDTLDVAWSAHSTGQPDASQTPHVWVESGPFKSVRTITGVRLLQGPKEADRPSYNWWVPSVKYPSWDYGPRHLPPVGEEPYNFGTGGTGTPTGDAAKYYVVSNGEIDPDQLRITEIGPSDPVWEYPSKIAREHEYWGERINGVLSIGPFELNPWEEKTIVFAYIGGEHFHQDPENYKKKNDKDIDGWYAHVDFSDLAKNANMAAWVFDNPGVDTDGDGNAGKFRVCVLDSALVNGHWSPTAAETTYYTGDGVPDWRSVGPPPAPVFWTYPTLHGLRLRFNGKLSETTKDLVTNRIDFEGYRVYCGLDEREASLALVASYDREDFDKYWYNPKLPYGNGFVKTQQPFTLERLRCLYGKSPDPCADSSFDPLQYTALSPLRFARFPDSAFYFLPHDYNADKFGKTTSIKKIYPQAKLPKPGDSLGPDDLTPDGYAKYYEYEVTIPDLLPTMQWFVNVTAFDYGDPAMDIDPLESSRTVGLQTGYALADSNQMGGTLPPVYVYPNPYYGDGRYRDQGLEGRTDFRSDDRVRRVCFVNVPARCTVNILTLDGDLVRAIPHDIDPSNANAHHEYWDMINKNHQTVVSGLYYWAVEGADGKVQIGKFVIIR